jgi:hypothetical protein
MKQIVLAAAMVLAFAGSAFAGGSGGCAYSSRAKVAYKGKAKVRIEAKAQKKDTGKIQKRIASARK